MTCPVFFVHVVLVCSHWETQQALVHCYYPNRPP